MSTRQAIIIIEQRQKYKIPLM